MPRLGPWEIALVLVIVLIIFGVGKLPQVGSALGKGLREFNKAKSGEEEEKAKSAQTSDKDGEKKES